MEKDIYLKDYLVSRIISFGKEIPGYGKVYYRTNEDLDKAKVYFEALLQTAQSNLSKIIISEENMHTK